MALLLQGTLQRIPALSSISSRVMKILLIDADGVTLKKRGYFSEKIAKEFDVPMEKMAPFYNNEFRKAQRGKADLKAALVKYLPEWNWNKTADQFVSYWFNSDAHPDERVFTLIEELRRSGLKVYLASDQERYRAEYMLETLDFNNRLDGCFFSYKLGCKKSEPAFFEQVIRTLAVDPKDITFLDDDQTNVDVAAEQGIDARLYSSIEDLIALREVKRIDALS